MSQKSAMFMLTERSEQVNVTENLLESKDFYLDPKNDKVPLKMKMELMRINENNQNSRSYGPLAVKGAHKKFDYMIENGWALMEDSHPITDDPKRFQTIVRSNAVAKINSYEILGNTVQSIVETLVTAKGKETRDTIVHNNIKAACSLRAMGSVKKQRNGISRIEENLKIITYDYVLNPSFKNSVANKIITESEVTDMILHQSENIKMLKESLSAEYGDIELIVPSTKLSYNLEENVAIICNDGQCMKVFLEQHIAENFAYSFNSYLTNI